MSFKIHWVDFYPIYKMFIFVHLIILHLETYSKYIKVKNIKDV